MSGRGKNVNPHAVQYVVTNLHLFELLTIRAADLPGRKMQQSMSRRANCWNNAVMESFLKTLKVERVHRLQYPSRSQARLDIVNWIGGFYNAKCLHSSTEFKSPVNFEHSLIAA